MGIYDEWAAYQFNNAVSYFGNWVESTLSEIDEVTKQQKYTIEELLMDYNEENREISFEETWNTVSYLSSIPGSVLIVEGN